jgi:predicted nucleic acid-binding protein
VRTLIDTNVLIARTDLQHPHHRAAITAVATVIEAGDELSVTPQNIAEFWHVATRPRAASRGGLGLSSAEARVRREALERLFVVIPETAALYDAWKALVDRHQAIGAAVFDIRLVAAMVVHRLDRILTFDRGFARYGVTVLDPVPPAA